MKELFETLNRANEAEESVCAVCEFKAAMNKAGVEVPQTISVDGQVHYVPNGRGDGKATAWYVFNGSHGVGMFGDYQTGLSQVWPEPVQWEDVKHYIDDCIDEAKGPATLH
jgi:hypothetical protein